jgi:hypothetical protein
MNSQTPLTAISTTFDKTSRGELESQTQGLLKGRKSCTHHGSGFRLLRPTRGIGLIPRASLNSSPPRLSNHDLQR